MSSISKLKSFAPGIAIALIFGVFLVGEYVVLPAWRAAQQTPPATPPASETPQAVAAPSSPAPAPTPEAAPAPIVESAPVPAPVPVAAPAPAPEQPAPEKPAEPAPLTLTPTGPQPVQVATTWSTYHGGPDLSGYTELDVRERPSVVWQVLLEGTIRQAAVADAESIYVCTTTGMVVSLDRSGKERWRRQLTNPVDNSPERVEAPMACFQGSLIVSTLTGRVHALDTATGEPRWAYEVGCEVLGSAMLSTPADPAQPRRLHVIQREDGTLHGIDFATGQALGKGDPISRCDGSTAIAADLLVYGSCDFALHVHNANDGTLLKNIRLCDDCQVASGPAVLGDFAYTGSRAGFFYCANVRTGGVAWVNQDRASEVFTTPAVAADIVVFGAEDGAVYALDRATGRTKWKHASGGVPTSAVIAGETVLVSVDGVLQALELATGTPTWNHDVSDEIASPAIVGDMIILGSEDGTVLALGAKPS